MPLPSNSSASFALERAAAQIVTACGGKWSSGGAMCHCPAHDDRTPSLSVRVGARSLLFKCFAGCATADVMRAIRRLRLAVPTSDDPAPHAANDQPDPVMQALARELWNTASPISGTPAERYLAGRSIFIGSDALRYHPRTPVGRGRNVRFRPAMIAAIRERDSVVAVQRHFLDLANDNLANDIVKPKRTLGRPMRGAVMLQAATSVLALAEGVETALSASILLGLPVWATLGNERLSRILLPPNLERLVLLPDNDRGGHLGEARARETYARDGLAIETLWPPHGLNDWNLVLRRGGEEAKGRLRLAA